MSDSKNGGVLGRGGRPTPAIRQSTQQPGGQAGVGVGRAQHHQQPQPHSTAPPQSVWATPDVVPLTPPAAATAATAGGNRGSAMMENRRGSSSRDTRTVTLSRGPAATGGLGFNIVGGEAPGEPIFVSATVPGGPADQPGGLRRGDQLLAVNGASLAGASHEHAVQALKRSGDPARLLVAHRPDQYRRFEEETEPQPPHPQQPQQSPQPVLSASHPAPSGTLLRGSAGAGATLRTTQKRSLHVRALFDYDPAKDAGLPSRGLAFRRGDILHVVNASDSEWWQARRLAASGGGDQQADVGIIPSKARVERRERSKLRRVNFNSRVASQTSPPVALSGGPTPPSPTATAAPADSSSSSASVDRKKSGSLLRKLGSGGGKGGGDAAAAAATAATAGGQDEAAAAAAAVRSYEAVQRAHLGLAKPVVLLGPLKDYLSDALTSGSPGRFGHCVPHTTRQPRGEEQDGRDYHFVASRDRMERDIAAQLFIEAGQYNGNLYGTSLTSVRQVAESGRHCILDVSGGAIGRLQSAGLHPVAVFVRPHSVANILELKPGIAEDQAKKMYDRAVKLEAEFGNAFTAIVSGRTAEEVLSQVEKVISLQADEPVWVPSKNEQI